eukprot:m.94794 g.94794  ORF g.94794 m.94794 type:complete len:358 (+) comp15004_c0_seq4:778-1851(+)
MPTFPCDECDETFTNMVKLRKHKLSGACVEMEKAIKTAREAAARVEETYKFDFFNDGKAAATIETDFWREPGFEGGHHSAGGLGSLGVRFLNLNAQQGIIVLKQGDLSTATEYFCSLVLQQLNVRCPTIRVLPLNDWRPAAAAASQVPFTVAGGGARLAEERTLSAGGVVQSFVSGFTLKDPRVDGLLKSAKGSTYLKEVGRIAAVDMLLNNFDRTPLIWDHEGNANNMMFTSQGVAAIDNATTGITNPEGVERYTARVKAAVVEAFSKDIDGVHSMRLFKYISKWIGRELEPSEKQHLQEGIADQSQAIAAYTNLTRSWENAFSTFSGASWGASGMEIVNLPFIQTVQNAFQAALT